MCALGAAARFGNPRRKSKMMFFAVFGGGKKGKTDDGNGERLRRRMNENLAAMRERRNRKMRREAERIVPLLRSSDFFLMRQAPCSRMGFSGLCRASGARPRAMPRAGAGPPANPPARLRAPTHPRRRFPRVPATAEPRRGDTTQETPGVSPGTALPENAPSLGEAAQSRAGARRRAGTGSSREKR